MSDEDKADELAAPSEGESPSMIGFLAGTVVWYGDLIAPVDEVWEADA